MSDAPDPARPASYGRDPFIPTPEMIAAAWGVLRDRWPGQPHLLGPGPGFREAIEAAFAKMPAHNEGAAAMRLLAEATAIRAGRELGEPAVGGYIANKIHAIELPPPPPARNTPEGGRDDDA